MQKFDFLVIESDRSRVDAVMSALAAGEILVRPHREGSARGVAFGARHGGW